MLNLIYPKNFRSYLMIILLFTLLVIILLVSFLLVDNKLESHDFALTNQDRILINNKAVGLMGSFRYSDAVNELEKLIKDNPSDDELINYSIAVLNRQEKSDELKSLNSVLSVIERSPNNYRAHYMAGLIKIYLENPKEALNHFKIVTEGDPSDAYAHYHLGQILLQQNDLDNALISLDLSLKANPYLRSALYARSRVLNRLSKDKEAEKTLMLFQKIPYGLVI